MQRAWGVSRAAHPKNVPPSAHFIYEHPVGRWQFVFPQRPRADSIGEAAILPPPKGGGWRLFDVLTPAASPESLTFSPVGPILPWGEWSDTLN